MTTATDADEAWDALAEDVIWPPSKDRNARDAFARHRPLIEAAIFEEWRKSESDSLRIHEETVEHHYDLDQCRAALSEAPA